MNRTHEVIHPKGFKPVRRSQATQTIPCRRRRRRRRRQAQPQSSCGSPEDDEKSLSRRELASSRAAAAYLNFSPSAFALPLQRYIERILNGQHHMNPPLRMESSISTRNVMRTTNVIDAEDEKQIEISCRVPIMTARRMARTKRRSLFLTTPPEINNVLSCCPVTSANRSTALHKDENGLGLLSMRVPLGVLKPVGPRHHTVPNTFNEEIQSGSTDMAAVKYDNNSVVRSEWITIQGKQVWNQSRSTHSKHGAKRGDRVITSYGKGGAHSGDVLECSHRAFDRSVGMIAGVTRPRKRRDDVCVRRQGQSSMFEEGGFVNSDLAYRRMRPRPFSAQIRRDTGVRHRSSCTWDLLTGRRVIPPYTRRGFFRSVPGENLRRAEKADEQLVETGSRIPSLMNNGESHRSNPGIATEFVCKLEKTGCGTSDDGGASSSPLMSTKLLTPTSTQIHDTTRLRESPQRSEPNSDTSATTRSASVGQLKVSVDVSTEQVGVIEHEGSDYLEKREIDKPSVDGSNLPLRISQEHQYILEIDDIVVHGVEFAAEGSSADPFLVVRAGGHKIESQRVEDVAGGVCERCSWPKEVLTLKGIAEETLRTTGLEVEFWDDLGWIIARGTVPADDPQLHLIKIMSLSAKMSADLQPQSSTKIVCVLHDSRGSSNGNAAHATFNVHVGRYSTSSQTAPGDKTNRGEVIVERVGNNNNPTFDTPMCISSTPAETRVTEGYKLNEFDMFGVNLVLDDHSGSGMDNLLFSSRIDSASSSSSSSLVQASSLGAAVSSNSEFPVRLQTVCGSERLHDQDNGSGATGSELEKQGNIGRVGIDRKIPVQAITSANVASASDEAIEATRTPSVVNSDSFDGGSSNGDSDDSCHNVSDEDEETNGESVVSNNQTFGAASFLSFSDDYASEDDHDSTKNGKSVSDGFGQDEDKNWVLEEVMVSKMAAGLRRRLRRAAEKLGEGDLTIGFRLVFEKLITNQYGHLLAEHLAKALPSIDVGRIPSSLHFSALIAGIDSTGKLSANLHEFEAFLMQDVGLHDSDGQSRCDAEIPEEASEMAVLWLRLRRTVQRRGRVPDCSYRHASDSPIDRGLPSPTSVTSPTTLLTTNVAQEVRTQDERRSGDDADDEIGNEQELPTGSGELSDRGYRVGRRINMLVKDEGGRVETCAVGILSTHNKLELSRKLSVIDSQEGGNSADNVDRCCFESLDEDLFTMHDPEDLGVVSAELFRQIINELNLGATPPLAPVDLLALSRRFCVTSISRGERGGQTLGAPLPDMVSYRTFSAWMHPMDIDRVVKRLSRFLRVIGEPSSRAKFGLEPPTEGSARDILQDMFKLIDRDSSGCISDVELLKEVNGLGLPVTAAEARLIVREYGGGDVEGGLSFSDFERMVSRQRAASVY